MTGGQPDDGDRHRADDDGQRLAPARVLAGLGRLQEAAQCYIEAADVYLGMRDLDKAIGNWERATRLTPGLLNIHYRLAQAYERTGQLRSAVREYLILAFNFQRSGDKAKALQAAERAKRLAPSSPQVLNSIQAIQSDSLMMVPEVDDEGNAASRPQDFGQAAEEITKIGDSHPKGPLGEATEVAVDAAVERLRVTTTVVVPDAPSDTEVSAAETFEAENAPSFVRSRKLSNDVVPPREPTPTAPSTTGL